MDTYIRLSEGSTTYVGDEAQSLFAAIQLRSFIKLNKKSGIIPTRGIGPKRMMEMASIITKQRYKKGDHDKAIEDLTKWIEAMKLAMPIIDDRKEA